MTPPPTTIDDVIALIERQREEGLHPGAQLYVSVAGEVVCDQAVGETEPGSGHALRPDHIMLLYSAGKPFTSAAILQLMEQGDLTLDDPIRRFIPTWGAGKERCTIRHVLTHMGGFSCVSTEANLFDQNLSWDERVAWLAGYPAEHEPGTAAAYHPFSGWIVLGEIVAVVDGRPIDQYLAEMVFAPLGMDSTYLGIPKDDQERLGERICPVHWTGYRVPVLTEGSLTTAEYHIEKIHNESWFVAKVEPGGGSRGPAHDVGKFYEALCKGGQGLFRRPETVDLFTATHRAGVADRTYLGMKVPWGLGILVAGGLSGPTGYRSFGHGGMVSSRGFCDPVEELVVVFVTNGLCAGLDHERRITDVTTALYAAVVPKPRGARFTG